MDNSQGKKKEGPEIERSAAVVSLIIALHEVACHLEAGDRRGCARFYQTQLAEFGLMIVLAGSPRGLAPQAEIQNLGL
jgi:hypothetical protein